jgi:hypothetical protein
MKLIAKAQALDCVTHREFSRDILLSAGKVAVILTQSWCPQWHAMKGFLGNLAGCEVYYLEYDRVDYLEIFREFKEKVFGNDQIPYIRYYQNGALTGVSNAVSEEVFKENLGIASSQ